MVENIFKKAAVAQANFSKFEKEELGYETKTTFFGDFVIAELCGGINAVKDTFNRAFKEWKKNVEYYTELTLVVNHLSWIWFDRDDVPNHLEYSKLYADLYYQCMDNANFKGKDAHYFYTVLD